MNLVELEYMLPTHNFLKFNQHLGVEQIRMKSIQIEWKLRMEFQVLTSSLNHPESPSLGFAGLNSSPKTIHCLPGWYIKHTTVTSQCWGARKTIGQLLNDQIYQILETPAETFNIISTMLLLIGNHQTSRFHQLFRGHKATNLNASLLCKQRNISEIVVNILYHLTSRKDSTLHKL